MLVKCIVYLFRPVVKKFDWIYYFVRIDKHNIRVDALLAKLSVSFSIEYVFSAIGEANDKTLHLMMN